MPHERDDDIDMGNVVDGDDSEEEDDDLPMNDGGDDEDDYEDDEEESDGGDDDGELEKGAERADLPSQRDLQERPEQVARSRAEHLQDSLGEGQKGRVTMSSGVLESQDGTRQLVSATSEHRRDGQAYIRPEVAETLGSKHETIVPGSKHAEQNIVYYAKNNDVKVVTVGAGRPVCDECVDAIEGAGGSVASPKKGRK